MEIKQSTEISKPSSSSIHSVSLSSFSAVAPSESENNKGLVRYGDNNLFPQYLEELAQASPVHGGLINSISQMVAGKGFTSTNAVVKQAMDDLGFDKLLPRIAKDFEKHGGYFLEVIYTLDRQRIARIDHLPYTDCRFSINLEDGEILGIQYSRDWARATGTAKRFRPVFIPSFDFECRGEEPRQVLWTMGDISSNEYYSKPDYISALNYIELDKHISIYHVNNIINGFFPSHIAQFYGSVPELDQQLAIKRNYESKLGATEAGGVFMIFSENKDLSTEITPFPLSDADKQYQFLSEESTRKIMIAHRVTSPLLFGIRDGGGLGSNKDEIMASWELFKNQVLEPKQRTICTPIEEMFLALGQDASISILPNTPMAMLQIATADATSTDSTNVASLALNGAQITSLVDIVMQAAAGAIPKESARAIVAAGFPTLTQQQIDNIFNSIVVGSLDPAQVVQSRLEAMLSAEPQGADILIALGEEEIDMNGYILIDAFRVDAEDEDEAHTLEIQQASTGSARPNSKSEQDAKVNGDTFITRYRYRGQNSDNTRDFCFKMMNANKLYRKEDIVQMENKAVNQGWGPNGADTYSIWFYKGGGDCHHFWQKEVYMSLEGAGIDVNNPNARKIAVARAERMGYKVRNERQVAQLPVDMPFNGFLPTNKRFA